MVDLCMDTSIDAKIKQCNELMQLKEKMDMLSINTSGIVATMEKIFDLGNERTTDAGVNKSVDTKIQQCKELMRLKELFEAQNLRTSGLVATLEAIFEVSNNKTYLQKIAHR